MLESSSGASAPQQADVIQKSIGAFGRYHYWLCFLVFLSKLPMSMQQMAIIFLAPKAQFTCDGEENKCPCENPVFDKKIFEDSMIMSFKLICERKWLASFAQMIYQFGVLVGSIIYGMASDRFGRRMPFIAAGVLEMISGAAACYMPEYWTFNLCRFINGVSVGGTMVIGFVHLSEFIGVSYRPLISAVYQVPFCFGHLIMPLIAFYYRDFRDFQFAITIPVFPMLLYFCFLPETPRWLIAAKRTDEAIKILERVAKINKLPTGAIRGDVYAYSSVLNKQLKKGTITDLFRLPNLRKRTLAIAYNWLTCSYCFYGVAQFISHLTGDIFINVAVSGGVTTIGCFVAMFLIRMLNRKTMLIMCHGICAVCFFVLAATPAGPASVACACIGVVTEFMVFILVYLYTSELFPTVVRSNAIGISSMAARIGAMVAPLVIDLGDIKKFLPPVVFAAAPAIAVVVTTILPETKGRELMTTLAEGEEFGKTKPKKSTKPTKPAK